MTGDPPLLFSRSWRRNFKDPHRGQKHSLGPLIITTGVPLFGRGALSRVQNCSAGVPRAEPPFTSSSRHRSSLVLPLRVCASSRPPTAGRSTHKYLLLPLPIPLDSTGVYQYFRARPAMETTGIIKSFDETRRTRCSRPPPIEPIERGITFSRSIRTATCWSKTHYAE